MSTTPHLIDPEEIMAHLEGELSPERAQSVAAHIESCAACQDLVTSLRSTSHSLSNWTVGSVPVRLQDNVLLAAAKSPSRSPFAGSSRSPRTNRWTRKQWIGGLAAAAAALVLLAFVATPNLLRSRIAANQASAIGRAHRELVAKEFDPSASFSVDGQPLPVPRPGLALEEPKGLVSPADRFTRADGTNLPSIQGTVEFNRLQLYAKLQSKTGSRDAEPMIARTVSLSLIAKDFDSARASLDAILARHNGYAADLNVATPQGAARSLQASLRIPASQLAAALAELKALGRVELETQNGEEVTQQHADLVARLKNSRETEQRLQTILTQRTGKISDVLEVEQEIARVRGEIEQMEAEQKNLEHRVDFATIDLKLSEEYKAKLDSSAPAISTQIHNAAVNGYRNVADTLLAIVLFFAEFGPVLFFWAVLFLVPAWLVWRRLRHAIAL